MAVIHDLREHVKNKSQNEYRAMLTAAIEAETQALMAEVDRYEGLGDTRNANRAKNTLMTIFALVEQVPWLQGLCAGVPGGTMEMRVKDAMREPEEDDLP
jgi:hypothetical protein